jgi:hypothetical protein
MCREQIHTDKAFEVAVTLKRNDRGCGDTLTILTRYPTANHPDEHVAFQITLPEEAIKKLGRFLTYET